MYVFEVSLPVAFTGLSRRQQPTDHMPMQAGVLDSEETESSGRRKKPLLLPPLPPSLLSMNVRTGVWGREEEEENVRTGRSVKAAGVVAATKRPRQQALAVVMRHTLSAAAAVAVVEARATTRARIAKRAGPSIGYLLCVGTEGAGVIWESMDIEVE